MHGRPVTIQHTITYVCVLRTYFMRVTYVHTYVYVTILLHTKGGGYIGQTFCRSFVVQLRDNSTGCDIQVDSLELCVIEEALVICSYMGWS